MSKEGAVLSGDESESWLHNMEGGLFEEEQDESIRQRHREAQAFAAKRTEMRWRLTHSELYDQAGLGVVDTSAGPIHFARGQGQQGRAWDCSLILVKYLDKHPEEVRGKIVLELGCGIGLPGVAAALLGASEVILTDMAVGLPTIDRTIEVNPGVADRLKGSVLQWGDENVTTTVLAGVASGPIAVILCSDLLYGDSGGTSGTGGEGGEGEKGVAELLAVTLSAVCSMSSNGNGGRDGLREVIVLSCHEHRFSGDKGAFFFESIARRGFEVVENVTLSVLDERYSDDCGISLSRIHRRG